MGADEEELQLLIEKYDLDVDRDKVINDFDTRKSLQKIVYITQESGVNLGYVYNWYRKGPYSPQLAQTYYRLFENIQNENQIQQSRKFNEWSSKIMDLIKKDILHNVQKNEMDLWLETVASVIYLYEIHGNWEDVKKDMSVKKSHLLSYVDMAIDQVNALIYDILSEFDLRTLKNVIFSSNSILLFNWIFDEDRTKEGTTA